MKKYTIIILITFFVFSLYYPIEPASPRKNRKLHTNVQKAIQLFKLKDPGLKKFFDSAYGYAVFPKVAKGGIGVGAATGRGEVYEKGTLAGRARLTQVNIGLQLGGQVYSEIVFFRTREAFIAFKRSKLKLSAQVSAVAAASGASANANYSHGVAIFTLARSGLMYEASVGGQRFKYYRL